MIRKNKTVAPQNELSAMSDVQREAVQADLEKKRMDTVRGIENLLAELSKKKKGKSLCMKNPKKLGTRPNDTVEE